MHRRVKCFKSHAPKGVTRIAGMGLQFCLIKGIVVSSKKIAGEWILFYFYSWNLKAFR